MIYKNIELVPLKAVKTFKQRREGHIAQFRIMNPALFAICLSLLWLETNGGPINRL